MVRWGPVRWGYLRPVQFLDHLTVIIRCAQKLREHCCNTLCLFKNRDDHRAWFECVEDPQYYIKVGAKKTNGQCCDQAELRKIIGK